MKYLAAEVESGCVNWMDWADGETSVHRSRKSMQEVRLSVRWHADSKGKEGWRQLKKAMELLFTRIISSFILKGKQLH